MNKRQYKKSLRNKNWFYKKKNRPKKKVLKYNQWLIKRYPFLLPRNRWTGKVPDDYFYEFTEVLDNGWWKAFGIAFMEELRTELIRCNYLYDFRIMDWKQKYGGMRFYFGGIPLDCKVDDIVDKYEELSYDYCETCGKPACLTCYGYWYETICKDCWDKRQQRDIEKGWRKEACPYESVVCKD